MVIFGSRVKKNCVTISTNSLSLNVLDVYLFWVYRLVMRFKYIIYIRVSIIFLHFITWAQSFYGFFYQSFPIQISKVFQIIFQFHVHVDNIKNVKCYWHSFHFSGMSFTCFLIQTWRNVLWFFFNLKYCPYIYISYIVGDSGWVLNGCVTYIAINSN